MFKAEIGTDINLAKRILEEGDIVSIPTETVYGLAANAYNTDAVLKVFKAKNRPSFDPLIVHTFCIDKVKEFVSEIPEKAFKLMDKFWPGPLTVLLKKNELISDLVTSGSAWVAVRIPNHPLTLKLLSDLEFPLAAPSANPFGYISPTSAAHVNDQLGKKIRYILDGGASSVGIESTIVGFEGEFPTVYRLGGISIESLEKEIGEVKMNLITNSKPNAPGMISSHYAPGKPVIIGKVEELLSQYLPEEIGVIAFQHWHEVIPAVNQFVLSAKGDLGEAARNLFSALRNLDGLPVKVIIAELAPEKGLGRAINDRLRRAAAKREH